MKNFCVLLIAGFLLGAGGCKKKESFEPPVVTLPSAAPERACYICTATFRASYNGGYYDDPNKKTTEYCNRTQKEMDSLAAAETYRKYQNDSNGNFMAQLDFTTQCVKK